MAIDHFDVPAIYLVDLDRLLPTVDAVDVAERLARAWRCWRPLATARALVASLLEGGPRAALDAPFSRRVINGYGTTIALPRPEQLVRKLLHFDGASDALRYAVIQSRRKAREYFETRFRRRPPRERLAL